MDFKKTVEEFLNAFLETRPDLFVMDMKFSAGDDVTIVLDGDQGVTLQDCLDASRAIEFNIDRDEHDFGLQVMSAGATEPLKLPRQYRKNIGRTVKIEKNDGTETEGVITAADDQSVTLTLKYRKPKEIGKGKTDVTEEVVIPFVEVKKATIQIQF